MVNDNMTRQTPIIEIENLVVTFGEGDDERRAVSGVSFSVNRGETFGLVGESGSGKSTILRAITGLVSNQADVMRVAGEDVRARRGKDFYRKVQMVFQDPYEALHPRHTIWRQLMEPARILHIPDAEARGHAALELSRIEPDTALALSSPTFRWTRDNALRSPAH